ncbi:MAG: hypothetical protein CVT88_03575 [Candidatus Altiarchaeales archaeon HGW-Altiarchaeales-1]|nr:MAG: hypothetical protein CVT88_03575 [Candidatus Altiarchaeales archaeon HGW-Altiarchaeales-1]
MTYVLVTEEITTVLMAIRNDLEYIKAHMVDADTILTPDEEINLEESLEEHNKKKTILLEDFEKEIQK